MPDDNIQLPEGTDKIIAGASGAAESPAGAIGTETGPGDETELLIVTDGKESTGAQAGNVTGGRAVMDKIRTGREKLSGQAADKARGLVGQGLERSAEALANVGKLVGDTADGLDERLGAEYGDYARRAAGAIESAANNLASKDADELIDDTRNFVRQSPGIALAGAAVIGFALARLVKAGFANNEDGDGGRNKRSASAED